MCGVGVLGNTHVLLSYSRRKSRSHHQIFIVTLATIDILACTISLPFEIADIRRNLTFTANIVCKVFRFFNHFLTIGSGSLQVIIAFERYRKICKPFDRQFTKHEIVIASGLGIGFGFLLSIPSFIFCGVSEHEVTLPDNQVVTAHDCTSSLPQFNMQSYIYLAVLLVVCTLLYIACLVMYIFVGKSLYHHRVRYNSYRRDSDYIHSDGKYDETETTDDVSEKRRSTTFIKLLKYDTNKKRKRPKPARSESQQSENIADRTSTFSLMMLLSTAISYAGFIPTIILGIVRSIDRNKFHEIETGTEGLIAILMRGYFLNNIVNPVVYLCMDKAFRKDCVELWKCILCPCRNRTKKWDYFVIVVSVFLY